MAVRDIIQAAAGALGGAAGGATYVEDVFSTYLYTGNGSTQTITNNIDLDGEGGLTWIKQRSATQNNLLFDTARGATQRLFSNLTLAQSQDTQSLTAFNSDGFSIGSDSGCNISAGTYASWTFRKAPKFFDVVTYTGDGAASRDIAHSLNSVPGCIIVKRTSSVENWVVYHRRLNGGTTPYNYSLRLNSTNAEAANGDDRWVQDPTATHFTVGDQSEVNTSGQTYVAYVFAHDAGGFGLSGEDNVISCGSFTGNTTVNLGYEPQWVLIKASSTTSDWRIIDNMRLWVGTDAASSSAEGGAFLAPNLSQAESNTPYNTNITPTGFKVDGISGTHIYIAIRRPMKKPESGTEVFAIQQDDAGGTTPAFVSGFPVDVAYSKNVAGAAANFIGSRLQGANNLRTNGSAAEAADTNFKYDYNNGWNSAPTQLATALSYMFRRAPGFFDVVCYTGNSVVARAVPHNLQVKPELIIVKCRNASQDWAVQASPLGAGYRMFLNTPAAATATTQWGNSTEPTATNIYVGAANQFGEVNYTGYIYVAYLFATCAGVSKVGSYTGTGANLNVDCGFSAGARFVLIKRTDLSGDWYVWDSLRGITAGNDPYLSLNRTAAEVTNTDYIDPLASGFTVTSSAPSELNASGNNYIFLAIA